MGTSQTVTPKYVIQAKFEVDGVVEKSDVVGALFGQTEGLFGPDLDLRELQKTGRIGRIEIELSSKQDKTNGTIIIPSSLDRASTALIAAAVESVDRVGPCTAKITLEKVEDARETKREEIVKRAQDILRRWTLESVPSTDEVLKKISEIIKPADVISFGPEGLSAGPEVAVSGSIIVVEGRADVINLLKSGVKNAIGLEGARIPETIIKLSKEKEVTAFLDGDRGGELILKELLQVAEVDYVARAPQGREVEDLTPKEVLKALRGRIPVEKLLGRKVKERRSVEGAKPIRVPESVTTFTTELKGTLEAVILNDKMEKMARVPVSELCEKLQQVDRAHTIVFDGVITQRLVDLAGDKGVKFIVGDRISEITKRPVNLQLLTFPDVANRGE